MRRLLLGCCLLSFAGLGYSQSVTLKLNQTHFQDENQLFNTGNGIGIHVSIPLNRTFSVDGGYGYSKTSVHSGNFLGKFGANPSIYQVESSVPFSQIYTGFRFLVTDMPVHLIAGVGKNEFEPFDIQVKNIENGTTDTLTPTNNEPEESLFIYVGADWFWKSFVVGLNYNHFANNSTFPTGLVNFSIGYQFDLSGVLK